MSKSALTLAGYIDAGTGSYLLAAVASGAAGIWFYIRSKAAKLTGRSKQAEPESDTIVATEAASAPESQSYPQQPQQ